MTSRQGARAQPDGTETGHPSVPGRHRLVAHAAEVGCGRPPEPEWGPAFACLTQISVSFGGGFVLLDHSGRDAAALAQRHSLAFRPGPDVSTALPAGRRAR